METKMEYLHHIKVSSLQITELANLINLWN